MNVWQLAKLTKEMRDAQKRYFKVRTQEALLASKKLEKQVDVECDNIISGDLLT